MNGSILSFYGLSALIGLGCFSLGYTNCLAGDDFKTLMSLNLQSPYQDSITRMEEAILRNDDPLSVEESVALMEKLGLMYFAFAEDSTFPPDLSEEVIESVSNIRKLSRLSTGEYYLKVVLSGLDQKLSTLPRRREVLLTLMRGQLKLAQAHARSEKKNRGKGNPSLLALEVTAKDFRKTYQSLVQEQRDGVESGEDSQKNIENKEKIKQYLTEGMNEFAEIGMELLVTSQSYASTPVGLQIKKTAMHFFQDAFYFDDGLIPDVPIPQKPFLAFIKTAAELGVAYKSTCYFTIAQGACRLAQEIGINPLKLRKIKNQISDLSQISQADEMATPLTPLRNREALLRTLSLRERLNTARLKQAGCLHLFNENTEDLQGQLTVMNRDIRAIYGFIQKNMYPPKLSTDTPSPDEKLRPFSPLTQEERDEVERYLSTQKNG